MTLCHIHLCGDDVTDLEQHLRAEHPAAWRARKGLEVWRATLDERPAAQPPTKKKGREPSAGAALPELSPLRVHVNPSPGRESAQVGSRPFRTMRRCRYCAHRARPGFESCGSHADLERIEDELTT